MKKQTILIAALILTFVLSLTGCNTAAIQDGVNNAMSAMDDIISGDVSGEIGKTYSTQWFRFNIKSIEAVSEYAGYSPAEGNQLIDVVVTEKNIFDDKIIMGTLDFYVDEISFEEYVYPMAPLDDTMMPEEFYLAVNESVEYHMVFEVPADIKSLNLLYTEIDENDNEGATFTIAFTV